MRQDYPDKYNKINRGLKIRLFLRFGVSGLLRSAEGAGGKKNLNFLFLSFPAPECLRGAAEGVNGQPNSF